MAVTALVSSSAALGLLLAGATASGGFIARTGQRGATATAPPRRAHRIWGVLHESAGLRTLVACDVLIGLWTGAFEVAATAAAARSGAAVLAAVPLSAFAAGSILVSLWSGSRLDRQPAAWRYLAGSLVVAAAFPLMLLAPSIVGIAIVAVALGAVSGQLVQRGDLDALLLISGCAAIVAVVALSRQRTLGAAPASGLGNGR